MKIWAIILAAGGSVRFGGPKALAPWRQGTLLSNAVETAKTACGDNVMIVTGGHALPALAEMIFNPYWETGLGSSVKAGLQAAKEKNADICILLPVDQPFVTPAHLRALADKAAENAAIVLSRDGPVEGPPAAIPRAFFGIELKGDRGIKGVIGHYAIIDAPGMLVDIDTPDDLLKASHGTA